MSAHENLTKAIGFSWLELMTIARQMGRLVATPATHVEVSREILETWADKLASATTVLVAAHDERTTSRAGKPHE